MSNYLTSSALFLFIAASPGRWAAAAPDGNEFSADPEYERRVNDALKSGRDLWGESLIARPEGPTYENVLPLLRPLMLSGKVDPPLTTSGVYPLAFGRPQPNAGSGAAALHAADGSEIVHPGAMRRTVAIFFGTEGHERYGQSLRRLKEPALHQGYQPALLTEYTDEAGNQYRQESFTDLSSDCKCLASFVRLEARSPAGKNSQVTIRLKLGASGFALQKDQLIKDRFVYLYVSAGGQQEGEEVVFRLSLTPERPQTVSFVSFPTAQASVSCRCDEAAFVKARKEMCGYWDQRLAKAAIFNVPEDRVMNAQRHLLIQNLFLGWRYSYGNQYQTFYQPEGNDTATVLGLFGFSDEYRHCHDALLGMTKQSYLTWENGTKLTHGVHYYLLTRDRSLIDAPKKQYDGYMDSMIGLMKADPNGLLKKEVYSGDIDTPEYYFHQHAPSWRGMRDMALVYSMLGQKKDAARYAEAAGRLKRADRETINLTGKSGKLKLTVTYEP